MKTSAICSLAILLAFSSMSPAADDKPAGAEAVAPRDWGGPMADITEIIARVAKRSGKQFALDPHVRGPVPITGFDMDRVDYVRLLAILRLNQYATFEAGGVVNVLPDANARQLAIPVVTTISPQTLDDDLVTVLVQVKHVCAAQTVPVLRPLMPQAAHLAALTQTNTLIISDRAGNARKIVDLLERLDKQAGELKQSCVEPSSSKTSN